jgi:GTP cyclohydrolase IA
MSYTTPNGRTAKYPEKPCLSRFTTGNSVRERPLPLDQPANGSIAATVSEHDLDVMELAVARHVAHMLDALQIARDHNTADTPRRVARMLVREVCAGRHQPMPVLTDFPNTSDLDQIYAVGPIAFRSCCAHHLLPIIGNAWIGVLPGERLIGLSKFHRLTEWVMARPQIQEEATEQLADALAVIQPRGLAVVVRGKHYCTAWRGVRDEPSLMTTSVMRGLFRDKPEARAELMTLIHGMGFA